MEDPPRLWLDTTRALEARTLRRGPRSPASEPLQEPGSFAEKAVYDRLVVRRQRRRGVAARPRRLPLAVGRSLLLGVLRHDVTSFAPGSGRCSDGSNVAQHRSCRRTGISERAMPCERKTERDGTERNQPLVVEDAERGVQRRRRAAAPSA